jgi:hypothetical protein
MPLTTGFACKRDSSREQRDRMADKCQALPGGSFPNGIRQLASRRNTFAYADPTFVG